jgi:hypothetical protein
VALEISRQELDAQVLIECRGQPDGVIHHAVEGHALITYEDDSSRASGHESSRLACPTATSSRGQADYIMLAPHDDDGAHVGAV